VIREHRRPRESSGTPLTTDGPTGGGRPAERPAQDAPVAAQGPAQLPSLPLAGFDRRRLAWILAAAVAAWILFTFARQVSEAADATARADRARAANATLAEELDRLRAELQLIQEPRYVALQARAYGVGGRGERQFTLQAGAPSLPPDAPGSASTRIGYRDVTRTPLEAWLQLLFGSSSGG
jgi:cell division protein FtsB